MTPRLDELFLPDRLRQNWQDDRLSELSSPQNTAHLAIHRQYHKLQCLLSETYPNASWITEQTRDLTQAIELSFELEATVPASIKQKQQIVTMLEELEELLAATDLPQWRR